MRIIKDNGLKDNEDGLYFILKNIAIILYFYTI